MNNVYFKSRTGLRPSNEDRHVIIVNHDGHDPSIHSHDLFCVFDGHGGNQVSTLLSNIVPKIFMNKKLIYPLDNKKDNKYRITNLCSKIQDILTTKYANQSKECGSTCLTIIKYKQNDTNVLDIINVGDSRAIVCHGTKAIQLTEDHKPLQPKELRRITKSGGQVYCDGIEWRIDNLSLSRAFGDSLSKFTQPVPDFYKYIITKNDKFMVLACDGLWDVMDNQTVTNFILYHCYDASGNRINEKNNIACKLADYAISQGSSDNVTVIIVFFDDVESKPSIRRTHKKYIDSIIPLLPDVDIQLPKIMIDLPK